MTITSHSSRSFYTPLLISLAGIVFASLAIAAYHLILVRFCLRRRRHRQLASSRWHLNQMPAGLDQKVLAAIPILCYSTNNVKGESFRVDQSECVVCLGELVEGDSVRLLPYCRHAFRVPCIDKWFSAHFNCPICRAPMAAAPIIMENPLPIEIQISAHVQGGDDGVDISASTLRSHVRSGGLPLHCAASGPLVVDRIDQQVATATVTQLEMTCVQRYLGIYRNSAWDGVAAVHPLRNSSILRCLGIIKVEDDYDEKGRLLWEDVIDINAGIG
ncbi:RING-H2 finger protein ATL51-like [Juglans microcarpa x Juglans regia]|uniref:RING-H2 finger protein ATL51-like n=1 Tax=Juglans microcarpa x Juglans regia TaxID=2249226 RepID=UPI001B7E034B|nr:RING-H2 finger protein ATL51-like [Juglans microcarpa x Juglans regia]